MAYSRAVRRKTYPRKRAGGRKTKRQVGPVVAAGAAHLSKHVLDWAQSPQAISDILGTPATKKRPRPAPGPKKVTFRPAQTEVHAGVGGTQCAMRIHIPGGVHGFKKRLQGFEGVVRYQQNYTNTISGVAGQQAYGILLMTTTFSQLSTTTGPTYSIQQNYAALNNAFPGVTTTAGSGPFASAAGAVIQAFVPKTRRFAITNINVNMDLANFSTGNVIMTIFAVTPKINAKDTYTAAAIWANSALNQADGAGIPAVAANNPTTAQTGVLGPPSPAVIGCKNPGNCPGFNKHYKILAVRKAVFAPGTLCNLNWAFTGNHVIDNEKLLTYSGQGIEYIAGKTVQFMYIMHGQLGYDSAKAVPTYTKPQIGFCNTVKYTMQCMKDYQARAPRLEAVVNNIVYDATDSNVKITNDDTDTFIAAAVNYV